MRKLLLALLILTSILIHGDAQTTVPVAPGSDLSEIEKFCWYNLINRVDNGTLINDVLYIDPLPAICEGVSVG